MELSEKNKILFNKGILYNMCAKVRDTWTDTKTEQELIDLWFDNYDFALINHYPSNNDILNLFDKTILRNNNILVDDMWSLLNPNKAMVLGDSESNIRFNAFHVGQIWVRDNSVVNIYARDNANITVCVMDMAEVNIIVYGTSADILVIKYTPTAKVQSNNNTIRIKENYTYLK